MKEVSRFILITVFLLCGVLNVFAQSEMFLSIPTQATYINEIVMGDTLSDGSRVANDRVYVLERGGVWFYNGVITNPGWDLNIKASDGDGALPVVYGVVAEGGTEVPINFIDAACNVIIKNVAINGIFDLDESYTSWTYGAPRELIVYNVAGDFTLDVEGCIFENAYQADLRTFAGIRSIKATDCIFANNGTAPYQSISNGRALDLRNVSCDSVLMVNNTFVNTNDRIVRHIASTARLNVFVFDHNTVLNNGGRYGMLALGLIGDRVQIKNNLLIDPMAFGADTASQRQYDFTENGETFSDEITNKVKMALVYHQKEAEDSTYATDFDIRNNYWYYTEDILDTWAQIKSITDNQTLTMPPALTDYLASQVDTDIAFIELEDGITFTEAPGPMDGMVYWNLSPAPEGCAEESNGGTAFQDFDRTTTVYNRDELDCSYPTTSVAYTAGTDGLPIGDLNWFPDKKADWVNAGGIQVSVETPEVLPNEFSLDQNYPNPFNPTTTIKFNIPESGMVTLSVFNVLGQEVAKVVNEELTAGSHSYSFNASKLASGVYIYQLKAQNFISSKKMMLLK